MNSMEVFEKVSYLARAVIQQNHIEALEICNEISTWLMSKLKESKDV